MLLYDEPSLPQVDLGRVAGWALLVGKGFRVGVLVGLRSGAGARYVCKASPHPYPSVTLDLMGIGALLGRNPA